MLRKIRDVLLVFAALFAISASVRVVWAQNPDLSPWQFGVGVATHTNCTTATGATRFCFASDGLWQSLNGAAYVQVAGGGGTTGVLALNGHTGTLTLSLAPPSVTTTVTAPTVSATAGMPPLTVDSSGHMAVGAPAVSTSVGLPAATSTSTAPGITITP